MTIKSKEIFAKECLIQGLFLGVNPHYLMAVAMLRSGIKDDTDGDRVGPYRVTQQEWDSNGGAADLEVILDPPDINSWRLQCLYAALTAYRAQNTLLEHLGRFPSAVELYKEQFPNDRAELPGALQQALDSTRSFVEQAIGDARDQADPPKADPGPPAAAHGTEIFVVKAPRIMENLISDFDVTSVQAAAVLGNIGEECDGFLEMQELHPIVAGSRGGFGWAQWTGPRRTQFEAFCSDNGLSPVSDAANYGFLKLELQTTKKASLTALKGAADLSTAVRVFEQKFEVAAAGLEHFDVRDKWAKLALDTFNSGASARVPAAVAKLLDPDLIYRIAAKASARGTKYWVIDQFNNEGGEILVRQDGDKDPVILASDTTIFPIKAGLVPPAIADKLSQDFQGGTAGRGGRGTDSVPNSQINERVFTEAKNAVDTLITRHVPDTKNGVLACAYAVNLVVKRALGKPIGGGLSTTKMGEVLKAKHTLVSQDNLEPGMIVISPTARKTGHVGIVGTIAAPMSATPIYSNSSKRGKFEENYSIGTWKKRYVGVLGLEMLFYALKN